MKKKNKEEASKNKRIIILILFCLVFFSGIFAGFMFFKNYHSVTLPKNAKKKKVKNNDLNLLLIENVLTKRFTNTIKLRQAIIVEYNRLTNKHLNINNVIIKNLKNIDSGWKKGMDSLAQMNITIEVNNKIIYDFGIKLIRFSEK